MWDNALEVALGTLWEALAQETTAVSADQLRKKTGLPLQRVYSCLSKMSEVELMDTAQPHQNLWKSKKTLDPILYARAVELGIPLISLEKTVDLSVSGRRQAEKIASSGQIDQEHQQRRQQKADNRRAILRGRAATRAASTDLAKIVQDAQDAFGDGVDNKVKAEIRAEAARALEALISALEKK